MKKSLLMLIAALSFSAGYAQQVEVSSFKAKDFKSAAMAPVQAIESSRYSQAAAAAPKRDISTGVSYKRPAGAMYGWYGSGRYQMYLPALVDAFWENASKDKTGTWAAIYSGSNYGDFEADADGNCTFEMPKIETGYINPLYVPTYTAPDSVSYKYGEEIGMEAWAENGDSIVSVTNINPAAGYYYGFSNGCVFGSDSRELTVDGETVNVITYRVRDFHRKPMAPFCIYGFDFPVVSFNGTEDFLPEGKVMTINIIRTEEGDYGPEETTDTIASLTFTKEDVTDVQEQSGKYFGWVYVYNKVQDAFGVEYVEPFIVEDDFVISIEGFDQEGVDFGLYMCDVMATERDYYGTDGLVFPTLYDYVAADGTTHDGYWQYSSSRQYNTVVFIDGLTDVVRMYDDFKEMTAPTEGGSIYAEVEEATEDGEGTETVQYTTVQFECSMPWYSTWEESEGEENYYFDDLPDWLSVDEDGINTDYYADYTAILAALTAEPLPADMEGRQAVVSIVSDRGAKDSFTVTQGVVSGVKGVEVNDKAKANGAIYNLAGQKVGNDYKGIVIENGKKVIKK